MIEIKKKKSIGIFTVLDNNALANRNDWWISHKEMAII
jgi:hypothetical protein